MQAVNAQQKALVSSPIRSLVCRHAGPVHAISASLHHPALLISCGLDGQVRVCSSLARQPLLELAPSDSYLFSVQWSPHRPMLFAVGAGEGSSQLSKASMQNYVRIVQARLFCRHKIGDIHMAPHVYSSSCAGERFDFVHPLFPCKSNLESAHPC